MLFQKYKQTFKRDIQNVAEIDVKIHKLHIRLEKADDLFEQY